MQCVTKEVNHKRVHTVLFPYLQFKTDQTMAREVRKTVILGTQISETESGHEKMGGR